MATSNSTNFNQTRAQLIERAFRQIGVGVRGEPLDADEVANGAEALNAMLKHWATLKVGLWKYDEIVVFLNPGQALYRLGPGGDKAAYERDMVPTKLDGAQSAGATALTVLSTAGMAANDNFGIVVADGTIYWTTIASVDTATTLTISVGLSQDAADGVQIYTYTNELVRPLKVTNGRRRLWLGAAPIDTPFTWMASRQEYFDQPNKSARGTPTTGYYDPKLNLGELYIWLTPASSSETVNATAFSPLEDMDDASNTPELPPEWLDGIAFNLAKRLLPEYEVPAHIEARVVMMADQTLGELAMWDEEDASIYVGPSEY